MKIKTLIAAVAMAAVVSTSAQAKGKEPQGDDTGVILLVVLLGALVIGGGFAAPAPVTEVAAGQ